MNTELENKTRDRRYRVVSVEKSDPPEGMPAGTWHCYIIGHGSEKIKGLKAGSLNAVTQHAEAIADGFNERTTRSKSVYAPRKTK